MAEIESDRHNKRTIRRVCARKRVRQESIYGADIVRTKQGTHDSTRECTLGRTQTR